MLYLKSLSLGAAAATLLASAFAASAQEKPPSDNGSQLGGPKTVSHYQCYRIAPGPVALKQVPITTVDQFGKQAIVVGQPIQLCNPTVKYHKGQKFAVVDGKAHLMCYSIFKQAPVAGHVVQTTDQFVNATYKTGQRTMFCAPSYKTLIGEKEVPLE